MSRISVFSKIMLFALLIALVSASFTTSNVAAKKNNRELEDKWSQLVDNYNRQSINHTSAHNWVDHWMKTNNSDSDEIELQKHMCTCNSALSAAGAIVAKHAGFDAKGNVVDRGAAIQSIKDLSYYLAQHAGSIRNLEGHLK